jgi:hypothetical protein
MNKTKVSYRHLKIALPLALAMVPSAVLSDAWGVSSFENDDALDWAYELKAIDYSKTLTNTAATAKSKQTMNASTCSAGLAAADILSALRSKTFGHLPEDVAIWAKANSSIATSDAAKKAKAIVKGCANSKQSELAQIWLESSPSEWFSYISELSARLK